MFLPDECSSLLYIQLFNINEINTDNPGKCFLTAPNFSLLSFTKALNILSGFCICESVKNRWKMGSWKIGRKHRLLNSVIKQQI
jgi:hypothetical protein